MKGCSHSPGGRKKRKPVELDWGILGGSGLVDRKKSGTFVGGGEKTGSRSAPVERDNLSSKRGRSNPLQGAKGVTIPYQSAKGGFLRSTREKRAKPWRKVAIKTITLRSQGKSSPKRASGRRGGVGMATPVGIKAGDTSTGGFRMYAKRVEEV